MMIEFMGLSLSPYQLGLAAFPVLILLVFLRLPIAIALSVIGLVGTWLINGDGRMINSQLKNFTFDTFNNYSLSVIPLFSADE